MDRTYGWLWRRWPAGSSSPELLCCATAMGIGVKSMITPKQAEERIADLSTDQVWDLTVRRIRAEDTAPVGNRHVDEPSEDLVIQLLRNDDLAEETRLAVISGCELVYSELLAWLAAPVHTDGGERIAETATRLCRVVDIAEPAELRGHADAMLNLALNVQDLPTGVLSATVRAGMAYGCTADHIPMWQQALERPEVAAYAFNALVAIDPHADRVDAALDMLQEKQAHGGWNVNTDLLSRRVNRARQVDTAPELPYVADAEVYPIDVVLFYNSTDVDWVEKVYHELRRRGLRPWMDTHDMKPGAHFQQEIEKVIQQARSAAAFYGKKGLGAWELEETEAALYDFNGTNRTVIPVWLPGVQRAASGQDDGGSDPDEEIEVAAFRMDWQAAKFMSGVGDPDAYDVLVWGITGWGRGGRRRLYKTQADVERA